MGQSLRQYRKDIGLLLVIAPGLIYAGLALHYHLHEYSMDSDPPLELRPLETLAAPAGSGRS